MIRWSSQFMNVFSIGLLLAIALIFARMFLPTSLMDNSIYSGLAALLMVALVLSGTGTVIAFLVGMILAYSADTEDGSVRKMLGRATRSFSTETFGFLLRYGFAIFGLETVIYWTLRWTEEWVAWWVLLLVTFCIVIVWEYGLSKPIRDRERRERSVRYRGLLVLFNSLGEDGMAKHLSDPLRGMQLTKEHAQALSPLTAAETSELLRELGVAAHRRNEYTKAQGIRPAA